MSIKLGLSALIAVALSAVAVGCGDDNNSSSSTPASSGGGAATSAATTSTPSSSGGSSTSANPQIQAAVDACKQSIDANQQVPANIKGDLQKICEKAASGDAQAVKDATKQVCLKVVDATVPDSAKETAKAACDQAGG